MSKQEPLGLGLIGCGAFGEFCLQAFRQVPEVRLAAVADVRPPVADAFAREFSVPALYDPGALIAMDSVQIVHIATPPSTHHELALAAARAGKHVLCEKPLALHAAEGREILDAAAAAGVICPVNFVLRYNRVTDAVKAVIESGVMGKVLSARLTNCASDTPLGAKHWFWDRSVSGGIFVEHGVHFFDLYSYWLGEGELLSAAAECREGTDQQDRVTCLVRHAGGTLTSHYHGFDQYLTMDRTGHRLVCELGDIRVEGWIPLEATVDAVTDADGLARLTEALPGARVQQMQEYGPEHAEGVSRGRTRHLTRHVRLRYLPEPDKQAVYADSVRRLLIDQVAHIHDGGHTRVVSESNGLAALALAEQAARLAAARAET